MFNVSYFSNPYGFLVIKDDQTTANVDPCLQMRKLDTFTCRQSHAGVTNLNNLTSPTPTVLRISVLKILCTVKKHAGKTYCYTKTGID